MHFNAENDLSQDVELTQIVNAICKTFSKVGNASLSGDSSDSPLVIEFYQT